MTASFHMVGSARARRPYFATDFSEYTAGAQPPDWTKRTNAADFTAIVTAGAGMSGKYLKIVRTPSSRQMMTWDKVPSTLNSEVLMRCRMLEVGTTDMLYTGPIMRAAFPSATGSDMTAYLATIEQGQDMVAYRFAAGTATLLQRNDGPDYGTNIWSWVRVRLVGNVISFKYWQDGNAEPAYWTYTDASQIATAGLIGLGSSHNVDVDVDYFAVSIGTTPVVIPLP